MRHFIYGILDKSQTGPKNAIFIIKYIINHKSEKKKSGNLMINID